MRFAYFPDGNTGGKNLRQTNQRGSLDPQSYMMEFINTNKEQKRKSMKWGDSCPGSKDENVNPISDLSITSSTWLFSSKWLVSHRTFGINGKDPGLSWKLAISLWWIHTISFWIPARYSEHCQNESEPLQSYSFTTMDHLNFQINSMRPSLGTRLPSLFVPSISWLVHWNLG